MLAVIETHPVQYHAPVYRSAQRDFDLPVTAIYGSDFSVAGYMDREFQTQLAWDTDLLSGYGTRFLSRVRERAPRAEAGATTRGLREALAELRPQAILLLGYSPRFHQKAFFEARRCRVPLLFRGETTDHARPRQSWKGALRDHALRWFYGRCARLLYVGQRSRDHFRRLGCAEHKLVFAPYCVDATPFQTTDLDRTRLRESLRARLGFKGDDWVVVFAGKLSPRKAPDLLVQAVKLLPATIRDRIVLLFVGEGELKSALARLAQDAPVVRACFAGFHNQTQLSPFYHAGDLLALPSVVSETWGLVVNEALHHGVPALVSDGVGCAPDLIVEDQTGVTCQAGSIPALAAALERALKLVRRAEVRLACRERVDRYSVRHAAEGIARAYRDAVRPAP